MISLLKKYGDFFIIFVLTIVAITPLFTPGFFPIHDDEQVGRLYELNLDVQSGQLPPRLAQDLGYGYDYPLFNFYPSFIYYLAEMYHLFGFSYIASIKIMIATGFIAAAIAMYLLTKEYFGRFAGIVSAVLYTYASYHSVDVYVRGALPEFWSFVFLPAIFWSFTKLAKKRSVLFTIVTGILLAGFVLTHNLIALMSAPFVVSFLIYLLFMTKEKAKFVRLTFLSIGIGVCLSAYFWLPELVEKQYTMVNLLTTELADYAIHFVYPIQFWYSPWGYGGSTAGMADGLSFQIGRLYFYALFALLVYALFLFKKQRKTALLVFLLLSLFFFSLFMQTVFSKSIWDMLQSVMAYIQFPWRFLLISNFLAAFAIGALFDFPCPLYKSKIIAYVHYGIGIVFIIAIIYKAHGIFHPSEYLTYAKDQDYISQDVLRWKTTNMSFEYVPSGIITKKSARGNTIVNITQAQVEHTPFSVISGDMQLQVTKDIPQNKQAIVTVKKNGVLQINVYTFPGWQVFVDARSVPYTTDNSLRLLRIPLKRGTYSIEAVFTNTPVRSVGNVLSGLMTLGILTYGGYLLSQKRKRK